MGTIEDNSFVAKKLILESTGCLKEELLVGYFLFLFGKYWDIYRYILIV
jgi:hypothetical protein